MSTQPGGRADERVREEVLNVHLESLLKERGLKARAERRDKSTAPDLRVQLTDDGQVLVECKWADGQTALREQLDRRVEQFPDAIGRVGVLYPSRLRTADDVAGALAEADDLRWYLHSSREQTYDDPPVRSGGLAAFADDLRTITLQVEGYDRVAAAANAVGYAVEQAASTIGKHASIARQIADRIAETDKEKDRAAALRIGCLVIFNALAFQERLAVVNEHVPTVRGAQDSGVSNLFAAWRRICADIDYVPVFQLAADLLDILRNAPEPVQTDAITPLIKAVHQTYAVEGHDLAGRLFHTLLTDAKFTGAYYTSIPAATLLARLVFEDWPKGVDWTNHQLPDTFNVADIACGTGTLLMAVAAEVQRRHEDAGGTGTEELHKALVEQALHGYDVQLSAIHFAATTLAMLNPSIEFDRMNLYVMPLGVNGDRVALGSLDFLGMEFVPVQHSLSDGDFGLAQQEPEQVTGSGLQPAPQTVALPELDLAIMNPPFTRPGQMLLGMLPANQRKKMQAELSARLKKREGVAIAGLGSAFVAAAAPKLRKGDGRLALILPITLCTGSSWQQTRDLIERDFTLDQVIASHDPERWNFSDSTDLSEVLVIATKRTEPGVPANPVTTYINLWRNPDGIADAHRTAGAVSAAPPAAVDSDGTALLSVDGRHVGESLAIPMATTAGKKWAGVQFARADLTRSALSLLEDGSVRVPGYVNRGGGTRSPVV